MTDIKSFLQKYAPKKDTIQQQYKYLHYLGGQDVWRFSCYSSARGVAIGLFWAMIPIPMQTIFSALTAIWLKANLPLAIIFVWVTNPLTMTPIYYLAYKLGSVLLDQEPQKITFEFSIQWLVQTFVHIWQPLMAGSLLLGCCAATIGNITILTLWKISSLRKWRRKQRG